MTDFAPYCPVMDRTHCKILLPLFAAALLTVAACAADTAPPATPATATATPARVPAAADFEAAIARLEKQDPQSPQAMNARLEYADFLMQSGIGDCRTRLDTAQTKLDIVAAQPAVRVLLPMGPARLADGTYRIHAGRADCDPSSRQSELQRALEAARDGARLYREALDYQSAAVMQFNVAATLHDLGDAGAAIAALETAIAMDREFGFRDDAADNTSLLLRWQNQDQSDDKFAGLMKDFPARSADLKFDWSDSDADVAIQADDTNVAGVKVIHSRGAIVLKRHVSKDMTGTNITYDTGTPAIEAGDWTGQNDVLRQFTAYLLGSALLGHPNFEVHRSGDFEAVRDPRAFGASLSTQVNALLGPARSADAEPAGPSQSLAQDLKLVFSAPNVQAKAMQDFNVQTATWAGAKLQQGVWYQMSAPLFLPGLGMGKFVIDHDIAFSFSRELPCTPGAIGPPCVELIVHATPDALGVKQARELVAKALKIPDPNALRYWSTTSLRLVVKPDTLLPYVGDIRRYWYIAIDGIGNDPVISSERIVATSTYH